MYAERDEILRLPLLANKPTISAHDWRSKSFILLQINTFISFSSIKIVPVGFRLDHENSRQCSCDTWGRSWGAAILGYIWGVRDQLLIDHSNLIYLFIYLNFYFLFLKAFQKQTVEQVKKIVKIFASSCSI